MITNNFDTFSLFSSRQIIGGTLDFLCEGLKKSINKFITNANLSHLQKTETQVENVKLFSK